MDTIRIASWFSTVKSYLHDETIITYGKSRIYCRLQTICAWLGVYCFSARIYARRACVVEVLAIVFTLAMVPNFVNRKFVIFCRSIYMKTASFHYVFTRRPLVCEFKNDLWLQVQLDYKHLPSPTMHELRNHIRRISHGLLILNRSLGLNNKHQEGNLEMVSI